MFCCKTWKKSHILNQVFSTEAKSFTFPPSMELNSTGYNAILEGKHLATTRGTASRCKIDGLEVAGKPNGTMAESNMELNLAWFIGFVLWKTPKLQLRFCRRGHTRTKEDLLEPNCKRYFDRILFEV